MFDGWISFYTNEWMNFLYGASFERSGPNGPIQMSMPCTRALLSTCQIFTPQISQLQFINKKGKCWKQEGRHKRKGLKKGTKNKRGIYKIIKMPSFAQLFTLISYVLRTCFPCCISRWWQGSQCRYYSLHAAIAPHTLHITLQMRDLTSSRFYIS